MHCPSCGVVRLPNGQCPKCSGGSFRSPIDIQVEVTERYIRLSDSMGEIVYWDRQEWREDPEVTVSIANAIHLGLMLGGNELRKFIK